MATLNFFNPATLLPSPEVAVKPPPQNNSGSFLISEALKETTQLVKAKRDVDSLKAEANAYADYVQDQSPELANLLRNKSSQYRIGMDTNEERSGFLKGVIGLSRLEQQDRKLELTAQKNDRFNNSIGKLNNLRGLLDIQSRRALEWDQEESRLEREQKAYIQRIAGLGLETPLPAPYVKKPNPYTAKVDAISKELEETINSTDSYPSKGGEPDLPVEGGFTPIPGVGGGVFPDPEVVGELPSKKQEGPIDISVIGDPAPEGSPELPTVNVGDTLPDSSQSTGTEAPPVFDPSAMNQGGKTLIIDPKGVNPPVEAPKVTKSTGAEPPPTATPKTTVPAAVSPVDVNDENYIIQQRAIAAKEAIKQSAIKDVKSSFDNIDAQKDAIRDKSQIARLRELRDEAEKEIAAINRSNPDLKSLVGAITKRYRESVRSVTPMTNSQVDTARLREGDQVVVYQTVGTSDGAPGLTVNLIERQVVDNDAKTAEMRIYKVNQDRTETDVTDEVKKKMLKRIGPVVNPGSTPVPSGATPSTAPVKKLSDLKL
jgi:mRNA-degrading endonuclease RelE of RelBE toxin-antitoxin system